jgi:hypothetical protein
MSIHQKEMRGLYEKLNSINWRMLMCMRTQKKKKFMVRYEQSKMSYYVEQLLIQAYISRYMSFLL